MRRPVLAAVSLYALLSGMLIHAHPAWAESITDRAPVTVRTGVHPEFDRVVFDFPRKVGFTVTQHDGRATVRFSSVAKLAFDAGAIAKLARAKNFTSTVEDGSLTVSFDIPATAQVKGFLSGNSIAIDVQGRAGAVGATAKTSVPKDASDEQKNDEKVEEKGETSSEDVTPAASATTDPQKLLPDSDGQGKKPLALTIPKTENKIEPHKADIKTESVKPEATLNLLPELKPAITQETKQDTPAKVDGKEVFPTNLQSVPTKPLSTIAPSPVAAPMTPVEAVVSTVVNPIDHAVVGKTPRSTPASTLVVGDTPVLALSLDPHTPTRAVVFARAGYVYVVLNRKITLSPADLVGGDGTQRVEIEPVDAPKVTAYRFVMPPDSVVQVLREDTAWKIYLSRRSEDIPISTTLIAQPDFALGSRLLLPLPDAPDPVRFTDPVVGDDLILVPLNQNEAFSVARSMADFKVIPAAQGLVIKPITDHVLVRSVTDGIEITAEGGLKLSPVNDTGITQQSTGKGKTAQGGKSIFDFTAWRGKPTETYTQTRQRLMQTIVDVPEAERNRARLELARFYFSHAQGAEALGMLGLLAKEIPDLMGHADFRAMLGASSVLAHRPEDGLKHLDIPQLQDQPEIDLWQAVARAQLRDWKDAEEKFMQSESILYGYPEPFRSRFMVLAIESAVAVNNTREASDWLDRLDTGAHEDFVKPAIHYLYAVLHAKAGRSQSAESAWSLARSSNDRLYRIRSELALIDLRVATGSLTAAHAADRLEALRFAWRGDDLEVDILYRLGQFYVQAKNVKSGLATMAQAVRLYPKSPMTPPIKAEMSKIFHDVFLSDLGASLTPLDALTLYQQYRDLMPTDKDGDTVMRNLAERLVEVDLLDQASSLLEDLVKNRLKGEERARTSARLAAIRLLDHKPDLALSALDMGGGEFVSADAQHERLLLRAKALSELHKDEEALALLQDNTRESAKILRADITMHAHRWEEAAKSLLELIGKPPLPGNTLTIEQAEWLVNCAIALSLSGNITGLDKLAIDYSAAMAGTPQSDTFRLLTAPEKSAQLRDLGAAKARIADVDMFQKFLNTYRKASSAPQAQDEKKP